MISASLYNLRQSPRKVRGVANLVRGKDVVHALNTLTFLSKKGAHPLFTLLNSALANAKNNNNLEKEGLMIKEIRVDTAKTMKRSMPRARGSAYPINKRSSHVIIVLAPKVVKEKKAKITAAKKENK